MKHLKFLLPNEIQMLWTLNHKRTNCHFLSSGRSQNEKGWIFEKMLQLKMHDQGRISIRLVQVEKIIGAEWSLASLAHLVLSSSCGARPWSRSWAASGPWHPPPPPPAWSRSPPARSWWRLSDHSYSPGCSHCTACLWAPRPSAAWAGAGWRCTRGGRRTRRWCRRSPSTRSQSDPPPEKSVCCHLRESTENILLCMESLSALHYC